MTETTQAVIAEALADLAVPIEDLKHHPENPKQGDVDAIVASLERFGQIRPIVVQKSTMFVCAGNHTLKAARALGWTEIAAALIDLSDEDALAYVLADNRTADLGGYDDVALAAALDRLMEMGALDGTG
ncbi:MAG TPA: ParB N-terminal domain-containing protein, partial [Armatimonadota bacterium]|nr:ParB N-terminal domain-containing protein [Armatimonadota bacterium]